MASAASMDRFVQSAKGYLNNDRFSDFSIKCNGKNFRVHRCFIASHSPYFEKACAGSFGEAGSKSIELKEDRTDAVERMIAFFYTFDYDDAVDQEDLVGQARLHGLVYATADKYEVLGLKDLSLEKFRLAAFRLRESLEHMRQLVRIVYGELTLPPADRALHDATTDIWLLGDTSLKRDKTAFGELDGNFSDFIVDLTWRFMKSSEIKRYCEYCGKTKTCETQSLANKRAKTMCDQCRKHTECKGVAWVEAKLNTAQRYW